MSSRRVVALAGIAIGTSMGAAYAQDSFAGMWRVSQITRPDWVEPVAIPEHPTLRLGDSIVFAKRAVKATGAVGCAHATYEILYIEPPSLFQGALEDAATAAAVAGTFGLSESARTLRVNCDTGSFDYHHGSKGLVIQYDNIVYTLQRSDAN